MIDSITATRPTNNAIRGLGENFPPFAQGKNLRLFSGTDFPFLFLLSRYLHFQRITTPLQSLIRFNIFCSCDNDSAWGTAANFAPLGLSSPYSSYPSWASIRVHLNPNSTFDRRLRNRNSLNGPNFRRISSSGTPPDLNIRYSGTDWIRRRLSTTTATTTMITWGILRRRGPSFPRGPLRDPDPRGLLSSGEDLQRRGHNFFLREKCQLYFLKLLSQPQPQQLLLLQPRLQPQQELLQLQGQQQRVNQNWLN